MRVVSSLPWLFFIKIVTLCICWNFRKSSGVTLVSDNSASVNSIDCTGFALSTKSKSTEFKLMNNFTNLGACFRSGALKHMLCSFTSYRIIFSLIRSNILSICGKSHTKDTLVTTYPKGLLNNDRRNFGVFYIPTLAQKTNKLISGVERNGPNSI